MGIFSTSPFLPLRPTSTQVFRLRSSSGQRFRITLSENVIFYILISISMNFKGKQHLCRRVKIKISGSAAATLPIFAQLGRVDFHLGHLRQLLLLSLALPQQTADHCEDLLNIMILFC
jgi:hypothetical protein